MIDIKMILKGIFILSTMTSYKTNCSENLKTHLLVKIQVKTTPTRTTLVQEKKIKSRFY